MSTLSSPAALTPEEVERACERDGKLYELIDGELKEKHVGFEALFIAARLSASLNAHFYPTVGAAAVEVMVYCFARPNRGRKPDVVYVRLDRLPNRAIPRGDIRLAPDLVVEVVSPGNSAVEVMEKIDEYLDAGVPLVWIVNPEARTIRVYRADGTTRLFRAADTIENEPGLPGFRIVVGDVFPSPTAP